jgi:ABC-type multidrug transport system fused ATPase/permease subunit
LIQKCYLCFSTSPQNIERIFKGKTILSIAHRLTTLKNADRILVFDAGKIAQEGSFNSLSESKGLFQNFLQQKEKKVKPSNLAY